MVKRNENLELMETERNNARNLLAAEESKYRMAMDEIDAIKKNHAIQMKSIKRRYLIFRSTVMIVQSSLVKNRFFSYLQV